MRRFFGDVCGLCKTENQLYRALSTINFTTDNIEKIIVSLNPNKAHGHDNIGIRMLKICGNTICKPLELIFKQALTTGVFPSEWKKGNIVPCYKKAANKTLKITIQFLYFLSTENFLKDSYLMKCLLFIWLTISYHLISLILNLVTLVLISFYQLLMIFTNLLMMDLKLEVFSWIYLKPSIKSGMKGLFKLQQNDISDDLRNILSDFLRNRKQRVTLNGHSSSWTSVNAGVPQRSILGPLLFSIYINDLPDGLSSNAKLFIDDTSLFSVVHDTNTSAIELNCDLKKINDWTF